MTGLTVVTLRNLTLADASPGAGESGGAITTNGLLSVERCTFVNNSSDGGGGALNSIGGNLKLNRCTFTGNSARQGGALEFVDNNVHITHCTFTGNRATISGANPSAFGGGAVMQSGISSISLTASILAGNQVFGSAVGPDFNGVVATTGTYVATGCVIGSGAGNNVSPTAANRNQVGTTTAMLAGLGYYGGTTPTMPPLRGSTAIDRAGTINFSGDQRGFRMFDDPDSGAAEYEEARDLPLYWTSDWDNDGAPYGLELATLTNPFSPNPSPLDIFKAPTGEPTLTFSRDPEAFRTLLQVKSSPNLQGPWTVIWSYNSVTGAEFANAGYYSIGHPYIPPVHPNPGFYGSGRRIGDITTPLPARKFYRLEAERIP